MRILINRLILALTLALSVLSVSALGCSYADGALFPTKYDTVRGADAIVLAQPVAKNGQLVDFRIAEVLKGDFAASEFRGSEESNSCVSYSFALEIKPIAPPAILQRLPKIYPQYLLFLEHRNGDWDIEEWGTEGMNEPINDPSRSSLLKMVRHFVRIAEINDYGLEKQELRELRRLAETRMNPDEYPRDLVRWIDHHFKTPTAEKSFQDLSDLFVRLPEDEKRYVLWAFAKGKHPEAADFFTQLLKTEIPANYIGPVSKYAAETRNYDLLLKLANNYTRIDSSSRWPIMLALIKIADRQHNDIMLAALRSADTEEAARLADWFARFPDTEALEIARRLLGNEYQKEWELTLGLAGMGDAGTVAWAQEFMRSDDEDRWIAFHIIAYSPLDKADALARSVIQSNDSKALTSLVQGYRDSHNPNRMDRLRDIVALERRTPEVENWLKRTLESLKDDGVRGSAELLERLNAQLQDKQQK